VPIRHLPRFKVYRNRIRIVIGRVMLCSKPQKNVTENSWTKNIPNTFGTGLRRKKSLVERIAVVFQIRHVRLDLTCCSLALNAEPFTSGQSHSHRGETVVMA
jgi:hypothetical protein